ncbi:MAG: Nif3-like dinuclear metal center hexameric protein [Bacteroidetes bacterium]|nr:Nif3-like dinuclear metal center hexameric protein [Bacteroidota bacterium]
MTINDVTRVLEQYSPLEFQEEYDNSGLLIGKPDTQISGVLISVDITDEVLDEAIQNNCNFVISHHPLIFKGLKRLVGENATQELAVKAIRNNIAIYAMHTNLDNSVNGLNSRVCDLLGLKNCRILSPGKGLISKLVTFCPVDHADRVRQALFEAGAGHIGNYDCCSYNITGQGSFRASDKANPFVGEKNVLHFETESRIEVIFPRFLEHRLIASLLENHPYEEVAYDIYPLSNFAGFAGSGLIGKLDEAMTEEQFLEEVKRKFEIPVIRHTELTGKPIFRVAICTGSGSFLIAEAKKSGADAFLTADLKYHDFFDADEQLLLADIGHYESERFVKDLIYDILIKKFPTFAFLISKTNTNPVYYY